jgi:hypothetical protein
MDANSSVSNTELDVILQGVDRTPHPAQPIPKRLTFAQLDHLTNTELIAHFEPRNDLSTLEYVLIDRLIRMQETMADLEGASA